MPAIPPVRIERHAGVWVARDDLWEEPGIAIEERGSKVRAAAAAARLALAEGAAGLALACARNSGTPIVLAEVARAYGLGCMVHIPAARSPCSPEIAAAAGLGAEVVEVRPGYAAVVGARSREAAAARGYRALPVGLEDPAAIPLTAARVPPEIPARRVVVPVGSGMTLLGVLAGLRARGLAPEVVGVVVGHDPAATLARHMPDWASMARLVVSRLPFQRPAPECYLGGLLLDPLYEAKCLRYLDEGDLLWDAALRASLRRRL